MAKRYLDGSYKALGKYSEKLAPALRPSFNVKSLGQGPWALNNRIWVLVSMLSTSYIAHYNAPKFYSELKDTDMKKFNKVVVASFSAAIAVFVLMMNLGYLTFGGVTSGFVLNNYANAGKLV
jgi:sodium-coupled neutral amino acid transporter 11